VSDTAPTLAQLRRLRTGFARINGLDFTKGSDRWLSGHEYLDFHAFPLDWIVDEERDPKHAEALMRRAWELGGE